MKFVKYFFVFVICCIVLGVAAIFAVYKYVEPDLPDVTTLKDIRLQTPLLVYSADGELIAQYGENRRIPLTMEQVPPQMVNAFIATEDSRFYQHYGLDPIGIARALSVAIVNRRASQGASTITQQLARNIYLSPERTIMRKVREAFLALRIERQFSKNEIMELYVNKIYLGNRAYGVGAAAYVYFGKEVGQLTLAEIATIAGLPKAPSTLNPLASPARATARRNLVLYRMLDQGYITQDEYQQASNEPMISKYHEPEIAFAAPYLSEMVRQEMLRQFGDEATNDGYRVYTTITKKLQLGATEALRNNVMSYDMSHGYRGPARILWQPEEAAWEQPKILEELKTHPVYGPLHPGAVMQADAEKALVMLSDGQEVTLNIDSVKWAKPQTGPVKTAPKVVTDAVQAGQEIWLRQVNDRWILAQIPEVNSAFISLNTNDGAIMALVGGFDFNISKFNRVTQSIRQAGSTIKPFIYAAALDKGMTLATILNDLPITRWNENGNAEWRPKNSPAKYDGPLRLRVGLGLSKNVMIVRAMRAIGVDYAADYLERFGFTSRRIERAESLALGAATVTPLQLARGYAVFANGGYLIDPYFIARIESNAGDVLFTANPKVVCSECNLPVIYGDTEKSKILTNQNMENVTYSTQEETNPDITNPDTVPEPELEVVPEMLALPEIQTQPDDQLAQPENNYAPHVISTELAFLMSDMLRSNIGGEPGGGWLPIAWRSARDLKRSDIGGKTGTTNGSKDAWFSGYGPDLVATVWVGFDDHRRGLGRGGAGAQAAQPAWNDFMKIALQDVPVRKTTVPAGISRVSIDMATGALAPGGGAGTKAEYFIRGTEPTRKISQNVGTRIYDESGAAHELF